MVCGFFSIYYMGKIKTALAKYEPAKQVTAPETTNNATPAAEEKAEPTPAKTTTKTAAKKSTATTKNATTNKTK